ncbi:AAA family ATPase [Saccharicrinis sp. FJH2]|uniref:AAA family ATPase n=1 Tax=Saccharicrinis sp. FJH65 TaxID=3344659 RepID=UPI0035F3F7B1
MGLRTQHIDTDNKEFQQALQIIEKSSQSLFLTGKAGTGKSTFLKYICEKTRKKYVVLAPTGIAAINVGGQTIHSFFKAPFRPVLPDDPDLSTVKGRIFDFLRYRKKHKKLIKELELVIIDEISMVRADLVDFIDRVLRVYSQNMRIPFGGKQVLMVGDVFQLEPVVRRDDWNILGRFYKSPFFFSANVFSQIDLVSVELKKVYRQKNENFVKLLDSVRINNLSEEALQALNSRVNRSFEPDEKSKELFITLATRKDTVDYINEKNLKDLPSVSFEYKGKIEGEFNENNLPTSLNLELKVDSQVMFIKNDPEKRWVNGSLGRIIHLDDEDIGVMLEDGSEVLVDKMVWRNIKYEYNEKEKRIEEKELGHFVQFPLRLAWAVTVHKSQGLTFDRVIIDMGEGAFAAGQTYVALSRCTSFEGIVLKQQLRRKDVFVKKEVADFSQQFNNEQLIKGSLQKAESFENYLKALDAFNKNDFQNALEFFQKAQLQNDITNQPLIKRFIAIKLAGLAAYKEKLKKESLKKMDMISDFSEMAKEFYVMGNECATKIKDFKSALANYNKAIKLNPLFYDAYIRRGNTYINIKDYHKAEEDFSKAIQLKRKEFKGYFNRGKLFLSLKRYEAAIDDLKEATYLKCDHAQSFRLLGDAYSKNGEPILAAEAWEKAQNL